MQQVHYNFVVLTESFNVWGELFGSRKYQATKQILQSCCQTLGEENKRKINVESFEQLLGKQYHWLTLWNLVYMVTRVQ